MKASSDALSLPPYLLFVKSQDEGVLPSLQKTSVVAPLIENCSKCDPLNYRFVSLTSVCFKVLERIILSQLLGYLELNGLLSVNHFGFRKGSSVEDQLLVTWEIFNLVDEGVLVDTIFSFL